MQSMMRLTTIDRWLRVSERICALGGLKCQEAREDWAVMMIDNV